MAEARITDAPGGERRRYGFARRPRCPACGSPRLRSYATRHQGDKTLTRYSRCRDCLTKLILVLE